MQAKIQWYYRPITVVIAILCVGPLALPLVWLSPAFKTGHKVAITILVGILTVVLIKSSIELYVLLDTYIRELRKALDM